MTSEADKATERLAVLMLAKMEHLDPIEDYDIEKTPEENWTALNERTKEFYLILVRYLAAHLDLWEAPDTGAPR